MQDPASVDVIKENIRGQIQSQTTRWTGKIQQGALDEKYGRTLQTPDFQPLLGDGYGHLREVNMINLKSIDTSTSVGETIPNKSRAHLGIVDNRVPSTPPGDENSQRLRLRRV